MATELQQPTADTRNYLEPDDEDGASCAQQLVNGVLQLDNYRPILDLEKIKADGDRALTTANFSSLQEKKLADSLQRNTNAWIATAKDGLSVAIDVSGLGTIILIAATNTISVFFLVNTCAPAISTGVLTTADVAKATQHAISIGETLKRIYNRACDLAVDNSNQLLTAIESRENVSENPKVKIAVEQHRTDLEKFQRGEVNVNVPQQSHAELLKSIEKSGLKQYSNVRQKADQSARAWEIAAAIGSVVLTVGIIIGFVLLKR